MHIQVIQVNEEEMVERKGKADVLAVVILKPSPV